MTYSTASCSLSNGNIECGLVENKLACPKCLPHFRKTEITPKRAMNIIVKRNLYYNCWMIGLVDQEKLIKINLTTHYVAYIVDKTSSNDHDLRSPSNNLPFRYNKT